MTDRKYGKRRRTLNQIEEDCQSGGVLEDLTAHIRELQAELAELKLQHIASVSQAAELEAENAQLKAERREFEQDAKRYRFLKANVEKGQAIWLKDDPIATGTSNTGAWDEEFDAAIVEQELNK